MTQQLNIPEEEFIWSYVRSSGPGGQNVNKVASKAVLRWNISANRTIPEPVRLRLQDQQRSRTTRRGELLVTSERFRDQHRNRADCLEKLRLMIDQAMTPPKKRKATRPGPGARERRLQEKRRRTIRKATRRRPKVD